MNKMLTLREAIGRDIQDGMAVAMGCALESLIPFAAGYEIIRQQKKNLTLIAPISDIQFDQIIGAGCAKKIVASWVGNVAAGLGHNFRRAMEEGIPQRLEIEEHSNFTLALGLKAAAMGLPFLPTRTARGSDFAHEHHYAEINCPFTREKLLAVRAIQPDVALFHARWADRAGNVWVGRRRELATIAHAARRCYVTFEELREGDMLEDELLAPGVLGSVYVTGVARAARGAWPLGVADVYPIDDAHRMARAK